jgi:hypothetical protein
LTVDWKNQCSKSGGHFSGQNQRISAVMTMNVLDFGPQSAVH